jgi:hypothetical protein
MLMCLIIVHESNITAFGASSSSLQKLNVNVIQGRAIAQEVTRRLPTAATRFRAKVRSCGICDGQNGTAPHSSCNVRGLYNRSVSGRRTKWTQSHPNPSSDGLITRPRSPSVSVER